MANMAFFWCFLEYLKCFFGLLGASLALRETYMVVVGPSWVLLGYFAGLSLPLLVHLWHFLGLFGPFYAFLAASWELLLLLEPFWMSFGLLSASRAFSGASWPILET